MDESDLLERVEARFVGLASPTGARAGAGGNPCQGLYWTAKGAPAPKAAFIATHYNVDFAEHYIVPWLATRGFGFLGWNTRFRGAEDLFVLEHALIDIGVGMRWLREVAGVETIVILGNSGGGSLMGAYQAEAAAPTLTARGATRDALATLPSADLYISLNAHRGRPDVLTAWMDASAADEGDPLATDPALDPFSEENKPPYSADFIARYRTAQAARNRRITAWAQGELKRLNAAGIPDRVFPLFRTWADLRFMDPAIDPSDRPTPMCYRGHPAVANKTPGIGRANTLRTWLSMWSLDTSSCNGAAHLAKIATPALVVQSMADTGVFPSDARAILESLGARDKQLEFIPGAHYFEDSRENRTRAADLICDWVRAKR